jgi:hypothetical protein
MVNNTLDPSLGNNKLSESFKQSQWLYNNLTILIINTHVITDAKNVTLLNIYISFPNGHFNTKSSTLL